MATLRKRVARVINTTPTRSLQITHQLKRLLAPRGHNLIVTAFPKSGSSFLAAALRESTGFLQQFLGQSYLAEQDLYLPRLLDVFSLDTVSHHHARANEHNLALMARFGLRPVILVRALDDCLVSLHDHLHRESTRTPTFSVPEDFLSLPEAQQYDALVSLAAPWYVDFLAGWQAATSGGSVDALWLTYEELMRDKPGSLARIFDFYGLPVPSERIETALDRLDRHRDRTRFNVGVSGRGRERLSAAQRERLAEYARLYPWVDFTLAGLPPAG